LIYTFIEEIKEELKDGRLHNRDRDLIPCYQIDNSAIFRGGKHLLDFTSADILGLSRHSRVVAAAQSAIERRGVAHSSSRISSGSSPEHAHLEDLIAQRLNVERALVFPSKNHAILALVAATVSEKDALICDSLITAPISDAAHLIDATLLNLDPLNRVNVSHELEQLRGVKRRLCFVEELRMFDGVWIDIDPLSSLLSKFQVPLFVDCSFRLIGLSRSQVVKGAAALIEIPPLGVFGDLSLATGSFGGFIGGPSRLIELIVARSPNLRSDTPLPSSLAAAATEAISFSSGLTIEKSTLIKRCEMMFDLLKRCGLSPLSDLSSPIIALRFDSYRSVSLIQRKLVERGFLVDALMSKTPGSGAGVLRMMISLDHSEKQIEALVSSISDLVRAL